MKTQETQTQLAADVAEIRQQLEQINQRLDQIYSVVARLAPPEPAAPDRSSTPTLTAAMMMSPASMLESLRQHAANAGLDISTETAERLQSKLSASEASNGSE